MTRVLIYFVVWVGILPWMASVVWLTTERLNSQPDYGLLNAGSDASFMGLFGVMFSMVLTIPLSFSLMLVFKLHPKVTTSAIIHVLISFLLGFIGGAWALWLVTNGGFSSMRLLACLLGGLSGLALAEFSYFMLRPTEHGSVRLPDQNRSSE